jgi:hypothetical protein
MSLHTMKFVPVDMAWEVGYWMEPGLWVGLYDFADQAAAARMVNYLNGGQGLEAPPDL